MRKLNDNVVIADLFLSEWDYDDEDEIFPKGYYVTVDFYGKRYTMYFTTGDLGRMDKWGLENSGCEGDSDLFDSANAYFEDHEREAEILASMMEEEWENNRRNGSPYNYMGARADENPSCIN